MRRFVTAGEVHLWIVRLEAADSGFEQMFAWLSPDEEARAARFRFERHRRAFVLGRGALRALLADYTGVPPERICFAYGPKGKPALADASSPLRFNTSNSGDFAAVAITESCEIGVDIERHRAVPGIARIAERFFSAQEAEELLALPETQRAEGFFNCWTRKEAYIKAVGEGFSIPLASFRVTLRPGALAQLLDLGGSAEAARGWTMQEFAAQPDYVGAVAYPGSPRHLILRSIHCEALAETRQKTLP